MCLERIYNYTTCPHHLIDPPSICLQQQLFPSPTHLLLQQEHQIQGSCSICTSNNNSTNTNTRNFSNPYPSTYPNPYQSFPPGPTTLVSPPGISPFPTIAAPGIIWYPIHPQPGTPNNQQIWYPIPISQPPPPPPPYLNYNPFYPFPPFPQPQIPQSQPQQTQPETTVPPPIPLQNSPPGRDFRIHTRPDGTQEILEHFPSQAPGTTGTVGSERRGWNDIHGWDMGVPPPEGFAFWRDRPSRARSSNRDGDGAAEENVERDTEGGGEVGSGEDEEDRMGNGESRDEGTEAGVSSGESGVENGNENSEVTTTDPENEETSLEDQHVRFEEPRNMGAKEAETSDVITAAASSLDSETRDSETRNENQSSEPAEDSSGSSTMSTPTTCTTTSPLEPESVKTESGSASVERSEIKKGKQKA